MSIITKENLRDFKDKFPNGIVMSNADYRKSCGISSTELKKIAKSPAHYKHWKENPTEDTPALLFGRACHKYMLEKEAFFDEFAVAPSIDRRTKEGKAEWSLFLDTNEGKDIITQADFVKIQEMHAALYSTPFVERLLSGQKELSFFTEDEETGLIIKARPDCLKVVGDTHVYVEYKTCDSADSDDFMKQAIKLMYDLQISYYKDILDKNFGCEHSVILIAQEKTAPYLVNVLEANEYFIRSGRDMYKEMLRRYADCVETGNWYGYMQNGINSLGLPSWLQKMYEI